jgi:hypothetical protein
MTAVLHDDAALLARIGICLYGGCWFTPMAEDLGVSVQTLRHWANGNNEITSWVWPRLIELVHAQRTELTVIEDALDTRVEYKKPPNPYRDHAR